MYAISTLLFLAAGIKLVEYTSLFLLDRWTTFETLHDVQITVVGPRNYVDRTWER